MKCELCQPKRRPSRHGYHEIVNLSSAGIYLLRGPYVESPLALGSRHMLVPDALILLDPASGAVRSVLASSRRWSAFSSTSAWATDYDSADPSPDTAVASSPPANRIIRLDLATGSVSVWSNHLGYYVQLMGIGAGDQPVVVITERSGASSVWMDTTTSSLQVFTPPDRRAYSTFETVMADQHGTWLKSTEVYLFNPARRSER